jgi:hypothetical protein
MPPKTKKVLTSLNPAFLTSHPDRTRKSLGSPLEKLEKSKGDGFTSL